MERTRIGKAAALVLIAVLAVLWLRTFDLAPAAIRALYGVQLALIYAMLAATIASGVQYIARAVRQWRAPKE